MKYSFTAIFILCTFSMGQWGCGPTCKTIQINAAASDTLEASNERIAWVLPPNCQWAVNVDIAPGEFSAVNQSLDPKLLDYCAVQVHQRTSSTTAYENNRHDYFDDPKNVMTMSYPRGGIRTMQTISHVCSSIGGWYGIKEGTVKGGEYGPVTWVKPPPTGYEWLYFHALQESPEKYVTIWVRSIYSSTTQRDSIRQVVERFVASVDWLTPTGANTALDP